MIRRDLQDLMAAANAALEQVTPGDAVALLDDADTVFIDVRESQEWAQGRIPGAVHAPRGFLEFIAHPQSPNHNPAFTSGKRLVIYCGSGGRSALAGKTLADMGFQRVANLMGGIQGWMQNGGSLES